MPNPDQQDSDTDGIGDACNDGADPDGDELLLYYLERGDTCSMTMSCCMGQSQSEIRAIAETDAKLIMVPIRKMEEWTAKYRSWRNFVFESYNNRLNEMLQTIDNIAFLNMDERLVNYLREKSRVNEDSGSPLMASNNISANFAAIFLISPLDMESPI